MAGKYVVMMPAAPHDPISLLSPAMTHAHPIPHRACQMPCRFRSCLTRYYTESLQISTPSVLFPSAKRASVFARSSSPASGSSSNGCWHWSAQSLLMQGSLRDLVGGLTSPGNPHDGPVPDASNCCPTRTLTTAPSSGVAIGSLLRELLLPIFLQHGSLHSTVKIGEAVLVPMCPRMQGDADTTTTFCISMNTKTL